MTLVPTLLDGRPNLQVFLKNFRALEGIRETEKKFENYVLNDPIAAFNPTVPAE
jgi:hypothetical protein